MIAENAPISWIINQLNTLVASGAEITASAIAHTITPLVSICFGIYIMLITINYMRGAETEPVLDFGLRCANFAVIIGLGINANNYTSIVIPLVIGIGGDLAAAVSGGSATSSTLDQLALHYLKIIDDGYEAISGFEKIAAIGDKIFLALKAFVIMVGLVPFLVAATLVIIAADIGILLVAMVGPIFFACLLFPATRQYFSAWVNTAFSYALIPLFVAVIAAVSVSLSKEMLSSNGNLHQASFAMVFLASIGNLILLYLLRTVTSLAASLSAGGINAAMPTIGNATNAMKQGLTNAAGTAKGVAVGYRGAQRVGTAVTNRFNSMRKAG